jgi:hypothetical protein
VRMIAAFLKVLLVRFRGRALDFEVGRRRFWLYPDGSLLPRIAGADGDDEPEPDDAPENDEPDPEPEPTDDDEPEPDDPEPPAPEDKWDEDRALRTIRKQRAEEKKLKAERDSIKAERDALLAEKETEQERTVRELGEVKAEAERLREAARSATINGALRDAAIDGGIDPKRIKRVLRLIDRSDIAVDEDGDVEGADQAVEDFLEEFPEFKAQEAEPEADPDEDGKPKRTPGANPDRKRGKGGELSHKDAVRLSTRDPEKFAEMLAEGKIPRSALGGEQYDKLKAGGKLSTASADQESA